MGVRPIVGLRVQRPFARRQELPHTAGRPVGPPIVRQAPTEATIVRQEPTEATIVRRPMDILRQHTVPARLPRQVPPWALRSARLPQGRIIHRRPRPIMRRRPWWWFHLIETAEDVIPSRIAADLFLSS
jgi:hypothetical protein